MARRGTGYNLGPMKASAAAHPNVALIKYWGKSDPNGNLPAVESLSISLAALRTTTEVEFNTDFARDGLTLNGLDQPAEARRLEACLDALRALAGETSRARVISENNFPTGAGLASSASGYAALVTAGAAALNLDPGNQRLHEIARIGSGSAPRSLLGGFVALRITPDGTTCEQVLPASAWPLDVVVAVTTEDKKQVSSREGMMRSQQTSPLYAAWVESHAADMRQAEACLRDRDFFGLADLAEFNCLKMHAVMLSTRPPLLYWSPTTLACMHSINDMRRSGVPVFFTIDAGPQVKAVCLPEATTQVASTLEAIDGVVRIMSGGLGAGAVLTN